MDIYRVADVKSRAHFMDGEGTVALRYGANGAATITTSSARGGLVVLHDAYTSGWRATVDGVQAATNLLERRTLRACGGRHEFGYVSFGLHQESLVRADTDS